MTTPKQPTIMVEAVKFVIGDDIDEVLSILAAWTDERQIRELLVWQFEVFAIDLWSIQRTKQPLEEAASLEEVSAMLSIFGR